MQKSHQIFFYETGDLIGYANSLNSYAMTLGLKGDYENEQKYLEKSFSILSEIYKNSKGEEKSRCETALAFVLNNLGFVYKVKNDMERSIYFYNGSLNLRKDLGDNLGEAQSLNNIGMIYGRNKNYENSIEKMNMSMKILSSIGEKKMMSSLIYNLAHLYFLKNDYEKSFKFFQKSLKIKKEIGDFVVISMINDL